MFIKGVPGRYAFKALHFWEGSWQLSDFYFLSLEEAQKFYADRVPSNFLWPVEEQEGGQIYIPAPEELE